MGYDDVPTDEAVDLVLALPPGSLWRAARDARDAWDDRTHMLVSVIDSLNTVTWLLAGRPGNQPARVTRPGDETARRLAREKARATRRRIRETRWEEVTDGRGR